MFSWTPFSSAFLLYPVLLDWFLVSFIYAFIHIFYSFSQSISQSVIDASCVRRKTKKCLVTHRTGITIDDRIWWWGWKSRYVHGVEDKHRSRFTGWHALKCFRCCLSQVWRFNWGRHPRGKWTPTCSGLWLVLSLISLHWRSNCKALPLMFYNGWSGWDTGVNWR